MKFGRIVLFFVLLPIVIVLGVRKCFLSPADIPIRSAPIERIDSGIKLVVTPILLTGDHHLVFSVQLETTQYPEVLEHDLKDTALLVDEFGNASPPLSWKAEESKDYFVSGRLVFPVDPKARHFKFSIEEMDDLVLEWTLPEHLTQ